MNNTLRDTAAGIAPYNWPFPDDAYGDGMESAVLSRVSKPMYNPPNYADDLQQEAYRRGWMRMRAEISDPDGDPKQLIKETLEVYDHA